MEEKTEINKQILSQIVSMKYKQIGYDTCHIKMYKFTDCWMWDIFFLNTFFPRLMIDGPKKNDMTVQCQHNREYSKIKIEKLHDKLE